MELTSEQRALRDSVRDLLQRHPPDQAASGELVFHDPGDSARYSAPNSPGSWKTTDPGFDPALWQLLCEQIGVAALGVPEKLGGSGGGPVELAIVAHELGRALAPVPFLGSAVLATRAIMAAADPVAAMRLLTGLASGASIAALVWTGPAGHWDPADVACQATRSGPAPPAGRPGHAPATGGLGSALPAGRAGQAPPAGRPDPAPAAGRLGSPPADARADDLPYQGADNSAGIADRSADEPDSWTVSGAAHHVLDGDIADVLIVAASTLGGTGLFEVRPDQATVTRHAVTSLDLTRRLSVIALDDAPAALLAADAEVALGQVRDLAAIVLSAEQAGAAARALELTAEYSKTRVQFGRPIGTFQALAHRLADLHVLTETARSLSLAAAGAAAAGDPGLPLQAAAAKAYCSEALLAVAAEMIQLHGAIGITWEHQAQRYFKRAHGSAQLLGQPAEHYSRIAAGLLGN